MTNITITGVSAKELRRLEQAVLDLCTSIDCYAGHLSKRDDAKEELHIELRTLMMALEEATAIIAANKKSAPIPVDQLALWD